MLYTVLTASRSAGISNGLTYESDQELAAGRHVQVPLRNAIVDGVVLAKEQKRQADFDVKAIKAVLGDKPLLNEAQLKTLQWMADYYCCSLRQALRVWLPTPPWNQLLPKEVTVYQLLEPEAEVRGPKQQFIIDLLRERGPMAWEDIRSAADVSLTTMRSLEEKGKVTSNKVQVTSLPLATCHLNRPTLSPEQKRVYKSMQTDPRPSLLFGVTGSGKTEIYAQLIADAIESGKQAMLLLPEILLTEHFIHRFEELLDRQHIAVIHSRLTPAQRRAEWRRMHQGEVVLVIGSRSALFSPLDKLGLVIIDEEHEWTYKNEQTPRYHTRETAEVLCQHAGAKLVLGSATPSLESWQRAKVASCSFLVTSSTEKTSNQQLGTRNQEPRYHLAQLTERYQNAPLPQVTVIDMAEVEFSDHYPLSPTLLEAIDQRLQRHEQSILFLNRRGLASALLCLDCRRRVVSPDSQLPFTLHQRGSQQHLVDHTTGLVVDVPRVCPACQSTRLHAVGAGTQRLEALLEQRFPSARILRADRDTLDHPEKMRLLLKKMRENEADILLGTQSVVKGLDLPHVTLSAVVLADIGLSLPHFRAGERIFQLLAQLTGRSGRPGAAHTQPGQVIIQTYRPESLEVQAAAQHQTETFLENERKLRQHLHYPPTAEMVRFIARGPEAKAHANKLWQELRGVVSPDIQVSTAPTLFGGGHVWHVLLRGPDVRQYLAGLDLKNVTVDVDPIDCV